MDAIETGVTAGRATEAFRQEISRRAKHLLEYAAELAQRHGAKNKDEKRSIVDHAGRRLEIEVPAFWSDNAAMILVTKYFRRAGVPSETKSIAEEGIPDFLLSRRPAEGCTYGGETSARQVFSRLAGCWTYWMCRRTVAGRDALLDEDTARVVYKALHEALRTQIFAPNSPQFFNTGLHWSYGIDAEALGHFYIDPQTNEIVESTSAYSHPQVHACFISSIEDDLVGPGGIMNLWSQEARIFKGGSGDGANYSRLRAKGEKLSGGGTSSGMMSFLKPGDASAGAIKSGGTTRRSARMVVVDDNHPEIIQFIRWKSIEERKVAALVTGSRTNARHAKAIAEAITKGLPAGNTIAAARAEGVPNGMIQKVIDRVSNGLAPEVEEYDTDWQGEAYETVSGQNANNSVSVRDKTMEAILADGEHQLVGRRDQSVSRTIPARELWREINEAAWDCADPGLHFRDTINKWHTLPEEGEITASNPCVTGDTLVSTTQGLVRIDAMLEGDWEVLGADGQVHRIRSAFPTGRRQIFALRTAAGYALRLTDEHKVMTTNRGDVPAMNLTTDDRVALGGIPSSNNWVEPAVAKMIGEALGAGNTSAAIRCFASAPDSVVDIITTLTKETREGRYILSDEGMRIGRRSLTTILRALFTKAGSSGEDKSTKGAFITLENVHETLLAQVQILLLGYEIKANLGTDVGENASPILTIDGVYRSRFMARIGFAEHSAQQQHALTIEGATETWDGPLDDAFASLTTVGMSDVYDLREPVTEHFVANGLIIHNCSEYFHLDDTGCNLASLRLTAFLDALNNTFDYDAFSAAAAILGMVLDTSIALGQYPSRRIAERTRETRTMGAGYADLGALLMRLGIPYDSDTGRMIGGSIMSLLTASTYEMSADIASVHGAFGYFERNRRHVLRVLAMHETATTELCVRAKAPVTDGRNLAVTDRIARKAKETWERAITKAGKQGLRNAQATAQAPTGTISFILDCDTTGPEPDYSLVKWKTLAGGGAMTIVNQSVEPALRALGYGENAIADILSHLARTNGLDDCEALRDEDRPVFDCATPCGGGHRFIQPMGHLKMLAALQPFVSGGISKTVNLPATATVADIEAVHMEAWKMGLKSIAVYRDGSKLSQPLTSLRIEEAIGAAADGGTLQEAVERGDVETVAATLAAAAMVADGRAVRRKESLPTRRRGSTQKMSIGENKIYLRTGEYSDGRIGEIFIDMHREGSTFRALMNCFAISISIGLQWGVPLEEFVEAFTFTRFEPAGMVHGHSRIKSAMSILDVIFRDLAINYLGREDLAHVPPPESDRLTTVDVALPPRPDVINRTVVGHSAPSAEKADTEGTAPSPYTGDQCGTCGGTRVRRTGTCGTCEDCGSAVGGCA